MKNLKQGKGITLIALVVTIIVLIILAGVSIQLVIGENGIITRAKDAKMRQEIASILEKLEMEKGQAAIDNENRVTLGQYIEQIKNNGIVKEDDNKNCVVDEFNIETGSCHIKIDDKYYFKIEEDQEQEGNIKIRYVGDTMELNQNDISFTKSTDEWTKDDITVVAQSRINGYTLQTSKDSEKWEETDTQIYEENGTIYARLVDSNGKVLGKISQKIENIDKIKPRITNAVATSNKITVMAKEEESAIIGYTVTTNTEEPTNFTDCENTKELEVDIENQTQGTTYYVWVKDKAGNISEYREVETAKIEELTSSNTTITFDPPSWTNQPVTATVEVANKTEGYTLQTSKDGINWEDTDSQVYEENGIIYARLIDDIGQEGEGTSGNIEKIDTNPPEASIVISGSTSQSSIPVSLNAKITGSDIATEKDAASGINVEACKYILNTNSEKIGTEESSYNGRLSSIEENVTIRPNSTTNWYVHVLAVDNAGNKQEMISNPIRITTNTHSHTSGCNRTCTVTTQTKITSGPSWTACTNKKCGDPAGQEKRITSIYYTHGSCGAATVVYQHLECGCGQQYGYRGSQASTHTYVGCGIAQGAVRGYNISY